MIKSANGRISYYPEAVMNQKLIVIDGKTYKSVDEMPEDVRTNYENAMRQMSRNASNTPNPVENIDVFTDKNNNGMPDVFKGMVANVLSATKIVAGGKVYNSLDELPPDVRAKYEQAMGTMDANKNGIPDFVEGMLGTPNQTNNVATSFGTANPHPASSKPFDYAQDKPIAVGSTIEPESSGGWMLALAGVLLAGLCLVAAAAGVWYFYFR
jgi:hypothetical protein